MKRKIVISLILIFFLGIFASSALRGNKEIYDKYEKYKYGFMPYYSSIQNKCSDEDRETAEEFITLATDIMNGTAGIVPENAGKLKSYAIEYNINEKEMEKQQGEIELITADFTWNNGYIWCEYNIKDFYTDGSSAETHYLGYWKLKKINRAWTVINIKEQLIV